MHCNKTANIYPCVVLTTKKGIIHKDESDLSNYQCIRFGVMQMIKRYVTL